jgi:hypothetical protein
MDILSAQNNKLKEMMNDKDQIINDKDQEMVELKEQILKLNVKLTALTSGNQSEKAMTKKSSQDGSQTNKKSSN